MYERLQILASKRAPWLGAPMAIEKAHLWQTKDRMRRDLGEVEITVKDEVAGVAGVSTCSFVGPAEYSNDAQVHQFVFEDGSTQIFRHQKGSRGKPVSGMLQPRSKPKT